MSDPKQQARTIANLISKNPDVRDQLENMGFVIPPQPFILTYNKQAEPKEEPACKVDFEALQDVFNEIEENFVGMEVIKEILHNIALSAVSWQAKVESGELTEDDEKPSNHIILTGNPGTGKTTIARYIGRIMHATGYLKHNYVHEVTRKDLVAGYIGQTALKTQDAIDEADGGVLFIDEAGSLSQGGRDFGVEVVQTLLPALENDRGNFICVMASYKEDMNTVFDLDKGLRSRFRHHCHLEDFTLDQMQEILRDQIQERELNITESGFELLVENISKCIQDGDPKKHGNARLVRNIAEMLEERSQFPEDIKFDFAAVYEHAASNKGSEVLDVADINLLKNKILETAGIKANTGSTIGFTARLVRQ